MRRIAGRATVGVALALLWATTLPAPALDGRPPIADGNFLVTDEIRAYEVDSTRARPISSLQGGAMTDATTSPRGGTTVFGVDGISAGEQSLVVLDPGTGSVTTRGPLTGAEDADEVVTGIAATAANGLVVATSEESGGSTVGRLYHVDPLSGAMTPAGDPQVGSTLSSMTEACGERLLGIAGGTQLVEVDRVSGASQPVADLSFSGSPDPLGVVLASMHLDGSVWAMVWSASEPETLYKIDPQSGETTRSGLDLDDVQAGQTLTADSSRLCRYPRSVSLAWSRGRSRFTGRVEGDYAPCTADERVRVFRVRRGPDRLLGSTRTSAAGRFSLRAGFTAGRAYALAPESTGSRGSCLAARSRSLTS